jgi:hypothetical protein
MVPTRSYHPPLGACSAWCTYLHIQHSMRGREQRNTSYWLLLLVIWMHAPPATLHTTEAPEKSSYLLPWAVLVYATSYLPILPSYGMTDGVLVVHSTTCYQPTTEEQPTDASYWLCMDGCAMSCMWCPATTYSYQHTTHGWM